MSWEAINQGDPTTGCDCDVYINLIQVRKQHSSRCFHINQMYFHVHDIEINMILYVNLMLLGTKMTKENK